jgi:hypothetical protein
MYNFTFAVTREPLTFISTLFPCPGVPYEDQ